MNKRVMVGKLQDLIDGKYESINQAMETIIDIDKIVNDTLPIYECFEYSLNDEGEWITSINIHGHTFYLSHDDVEYMCHWLLEILNK